MNTFACRNCGTVTDEYYDGGHRQCKPCLRRKQRDRLSDPRLRQERNLRHLYGIGADDYDAMFEAQNGGCAICGGSCPTGRRLSVDHNAKTGQIRELLCQACNTALGKFKEDPFLLESAMVYLAKHQKRLR